MLSYVMHGHGASCPARSAPAACVCEGKMYVLTGALAVFAGGMQAAIGWWSSMALLSDALHAIADGAADFFAAWLAGHISRNPHKEKSLRHTGGKIIAASLAASALWVAHEAVGRAVAGTHTVIPILLFFGGAGGMAVDALRLRLLRKAQENAPNSTRAGLVAHAQSDMWRSGIAAFVGALLLAGEMLIKARWFTVGISYLDLALSIILSGYMLFLAKGIWQGEHACGHKHHHHPH